MTGGECILLGSLKKTHGIRGELILKTADLSLEPGKQWEYLFLEIDGILVPFFISCLHHLRNDEWVVKFDGIADKDKAGSMTGYKVWISKELAAGASGDIFYDCLEGYTIHDETSGRSGRITKFLDIPGNPVWNTVIEGKDMLIPVREAFIIRMDEAGGKIYMKLPQGLL